MDRIAYIIDETFIYWSQIIVTLAALTAICFFLCFYLRKSGNALGAALLIPIAIAISLFLSRLTHWYCRADSYESLNAALSDFSSGGYTLMGVFGGCLLAACLLRMIHAVNNLPELLDCMALGGAAGIAVGRLASLFNSSDRGPLVKSISGLPFVYSVSNTVTGVVENRLATFMIQAMVTGLLFAVLALFWMDGTRPKNRKRLKDGDTCLIFLLIYGASQIVLDSTRYDSLFMRSNGFISIVQILGLIGMLVPIVLFSIRMVKARKWHGWFVVLWVLQLATLGGTGYMEYHVQRHGDQAVFAYSVMSLCLSLCILLTLLIRQLAVIRERQLRKR